MKTAELSLGYYKQGDDAGHYLEECEGDVVAALKLHAENMRSVAKHLDSLAEEVEKTGKANEFAMQGDTHMIFVTGPDELIDQLLETELIERSPFDDEEEEEVEES